MHVSLIPFVNRSFRPIVQDVQYVHHVCSFQVSSHSTHSTHLIGGRARPVFFAGLFLASAFGDNGNKCCGGGALGCCGAPIFDWGARSRDDCGGRVGVEFLAGGRDDCGGIVGFVGVTFIDEFHG